MTETVITMYFTLMPAILAGILTMAWCRLPVLRTLKRPVDGGKTLRDGNRIFGDNKTWQGFAGYVLLNAAAALFWGAVSAQSVFLTEHNYFYRCWENTPGYNLRIGLLLGLGYALFELPNSFLKRRLGIAPGKAVQGGWKPFFIFLDQADSVIGCTFVVWMHYDLGWKLFVGFIIVGAGTHLVLNMLLYAAGLRSNRF